MIKKFFISALLLLSLSAGAVYAQFADNLKFDGYISDNAKMKNVTENRSLKAENTDFCNSEIHDPKDQENIKENKENKEMTTITVNVTGMMCGHCEAHVTKAVKEAFGVEDVVSSHEKGTTVIHAPEKLDEDKIREVIKEAGYEVTGITQE